MRSWGETGLTEGQTWQLADSKMWRSRVILFGVVLCFLQSAFLQTAAQQPDFLSIDCGNSVTISTDPTTANQSIVWQPDEYFTGGDTTVVDSNIFGAAQIAPVLQTLRFFKGNQSKSCYILPVTPGYPSLVRATFLYGNYDSSNVPPVFDLSLDATLWTTVNITDPSTPLYFENIFTPNASEVSVCLIRRTPDHVPFISSLELRTMADDSYPLSAKNHLHILKRVNFGGEEIRYNKDPWDRIWDVGVDAFPALKNTTWNVTADRLNQQKAGVDQIPASVLMTAITAPNISFSLSVPETPVYSSLFFAELNSSAFRSITVDVDGNSQNVNLTQIVDINGTGDGSLVLHTLNFTLNVPENLITYTLRKNSSPLDPLLNALEVYSSVPAREPTDAGLVSALKQLKSESNISDWVGDPCLPVSWRELGCTVDVVPPTVVSLDLSGRNPSGSIPEAIQKLTSLRTLLLNSSGFTGSVPDFSSLVSLEYLDLSNNQLSGDFPSWLEGLQNLKQLNIANNNITGIVPPCLVNKLGSNFTYDGNIGLPTPLPNSCGEPGPPPSSSGGSNVGVIAGVVIAAVFVVLVIAGLLIWQQRRGKSDYTKDTRALLHSVSHNLGPVPQNDIDPHPRGVAGSPLVRQMSEAEIREATNDYQTQIAEGVFYGKLSKGNQEVAVKVLSEFSQQETQDFTNEVSELGQLQHKHLVALLGFSVQGNGKKSKLVYEYMEGRDLHQRLHGPFTDHSLRLTWKERINIALDTAVGLQYLHSRELLHLDLNSSSILLNRKNTAKIANYRLGTKAEAGELEKFLEVKGTTGYVDPDSVVTDVWSTKSDVYSFGVLQLELVCGRTPFSVCPPFNAWLHIVDWVNQTWQGGEPEEIVDAALDHVYNKLALRKYLELALRCTDSQASNRPLMTEVVHELENIIQTDMENRAG